MPNKTNDIELRSEEVQDILTRVPHWMIRYGNVLFLLLILLLLFLTWLIKYPDVIVSQALITTEIPPQKEFAKTTGRIQHLLVQNNNIISKNQPLAIIENPANYRDVHYLKSIIDTIHISSNTFIFPMDSIPVLFLGNLETDFALFQNNYIQYQLNKELQPFENEALANRITKTELQSRLALLENQKTLNKGEMDFKSNELQRYRTLYEKGVIALQEYESKQLEFLQAERNYKNIDVSISQLKGNMDVAQTTIRGTLITKTNEELRLLKNTLQSFNQLKNAIKDWELQYTFVSNLEGKVSFINLWNENQIINAGDLIFTVIPKQNTHFIARLKTPMQNSGKIKEGQKVNIRLENYPDEEFGILIGTVKNISLLPDNNGFYSVEVELKTKNSGTLITSYNKEIEFTQEMQGIAEIVTEDLRLIERLFYKLRGVFNNS